MGTEEIQYGQARPALAPAFLTRMKIISMMMMLRLGFRLKRTGSGEGLQEMLVPSGGP